MRPRGQEAHRLVVAGKQWVRCAITDLGAQQLDSAAARLMHLREQVQRWSIDEIDILQLREKQLEADEVLSLAIAARAILDRCPPRPDGSPRTRLVLNGRPDLAIAAGAHGVHLTARDGEVTPAQVRAAFRHAGRSSAFVSVSCHTLADVTSAHCSGVDLVLFGPVFEKRVAGTLVTPGLGLPTLAAACRAAAGTPVLALGGITPANTPGCLQAGAAGVAGIRLFA